ncbi:MAG: hypothetical protein LLG04_07125 [Parachlamydia sp.]|nr:hypothetical protein [Parachlamydia sp.]
MDPSPSVGGRSSKTAVQTADNKSKETAAPAPVTLTIQQSSQLNRSIARVFNQNPRNVERLPLPLVDLLESVQGISASDPDILLNINCKAMESCIFPCLAAFAPDHPIPIDFAFLSQVFNSLILK